MQAITAKSVFIFVIAVFSMSLMVGCSHLERSPNNRPGYLAYHKPLPQAERELNEARAAGKDKECPAEFKAASDMVDKAYEVYMACHTQEAIDMAQEAIGKIRALCPARPRTEMKPEPMPESKPEPKAAQKAAPKAAPMVVEKEIVLEDVHFGLNKSTLTKEAQTILKRNIQVLKENPGIKIVIQGHTSAIATKEYNRKLSERRAASVKEFLMKEGGIAPDRLSTVGYGETRLEMPEPNPEKTESVAAKVNRRVTFKVIEK